MTPSTPTQRAPRGDQGAAIFIALWSVLIMSLLVIAMAANMRLELKVTGFYRHRLQAKANARSGVEWAKFMLTKSASSFTDEDVYGEAFENQVKDLRRGLGLQTGKPAFDATNINGDFEIHIKQEPSYRNVNTLSEFEWDELFKNSNVPDDDELHAKLRDCLMDWTDEGDGYRLLGAESDDSFYEKADYEVKNGPIDTIDELLLIKHWNEEILFGTDYILSQGKESMIDVEDEDEPFITGIGHLLTTFGDGKVNVNSAPVTVLRTLPELYYNQEAMIAIQTYRRTGLDLVQGDGNDGFSSVQEVLSVTGLDSSFAQKITVNDRRFIRIDAIGIAGTPPSDDEDTEDDDDDDDSPDPRSTFSRDADNQGKVRYLISTTFRQDGNQFMPLRWHEEIIQ